MNKPEQLSFFSDKVMAQLHDKVVLQLGPLSELQPRDPEEYFWELCESILGQQLSEKVAPQIVARVKNVLRINLSQLSYWPLKTRLSEQPAFPSPRFLISRMSLKLGRAEQSVLTSLRLSLTKRLSRSLLKSKVWAGGQLRCF